MITPAFAQSAAGAFPDLFSLTPFVLVFIIMYFLMIRPQQRKAKQHQEMIKAVRRGDQVIMNGGLIGKVSKVVDDSEIELEVAEGVKVRVLRGMIADVRVKGEPVKS